MSPTMKPLLLFSLKHKMIIMILLLMNIPFLITGYTIIHLTKSALLAEKGDKLLAFTRVLNGRLGPGGFAAILREHNATDAPREEQIRVLNQALREATDAVSSVAPGIGVGYYSRDLDAILTYGPEKEFFFAVGRSIPPTHPGRIVMAEGMEMVDSGTMVRGDILNAMIPITREGAVIGYIWSNELTTDIEQKFNDTSSSLLAIVVLCFTATFGMIILISRRTLIDVENIIHGVRAMRFDLTRRLRPTTGDLGEVVESINTMAAALGNTRTLSEVVFASMDNGMITVDDKCQLTAINPSAERTTGHRSEEVLGRPLREVFGPGPISDSLTKTLHFSKLDVLREVKCRLKDKDFYLIITTSVLRNIHGKKVGALMTFRDVTERFMLQEQVRMADRLSILGELMAGVAHEIRNPLTSIKGILQYFKNAGDKAARQSYIPMLLHEVDRMNNIIEDLLFFARPNESFRSTVHIDDILRKSLFLIRHQAAKQAVSFTMDIPEDLPAMVLDTEQFKQVFLNLLINAVQAMEGTGNITVRARVVPKEKTMEICFADTGPGIPPEERNAIFAPFHTTKKTGTGLGLSVSQRIVLAHGGKIEADETPTGGALLRITLPLPDGVDDQ